MKALCIKKRMLFGLLILLLSTLGVQSCTVNYLPFNSTDQISKTDPQEIIPTSDATPTEISTLSPGDSQPVSTQTPEKKEVNYPKIANLWGLDTLDTDPAVYAGFSLFVPYVFPDPPGQSQTLRALNPDIKILHNQYGTKGRPEFDPIFQEWWDSKPGDPGYVCFFRNSQGAILLVKVWNHPMVNMTVSSCRQAMVQKNIEDFKESSYVDGRNKIYDGVYWDLVFGRIDWLGDDIDSNVDGLPDDQVLLNKAYKQGVMDYLSQIRASLPDAILAGNEADLDYSQWMDGRLFEWQLSNLMDGADYLTWDEVMAEYRRWTIDANNRHTTIIQNSPTAAFADKYPGDDLDRIPPEIMAEAEASYQRVRYGLSSALMGNGFFYFDFGPMIHGYPWWYDEYGAPVGSTQSTLPERGYLGQPAGDPYILDNNSGVWARAFDHGLAVVNPTLQEKTVQLPAEFCKINGSQAPLFEATVDDDQAVLTGSWKKQSAQLNQFGATVQQANPASTSTAVYAPDLAYSEDYEVFAWVSPSTGQSSAVQVTVHHAQGDAGVQLDAKTGNLGWRSLGVFPFNKGKTGSIELHSGGNGVVIADAFKWESVKRYNDGSKVNQITLQPQDGIVLISCKTS